MREQGGCIGGKKNGKGGNYAIISSKTNYYKLNNKFIFLSRHFCFLFVHVYVCDLCMCVYVHVHELARVDIKRLPLFLLYDKSTHHPLGHLSDPFVFFKYRKYSVRR